MLNETEIQPALTAEEWQEALTPQSEYPFYKTRGDVLLGWATSEAQDLGRHNPTYALGAYALFRSAHGFTREDVNMLRRFAASTTAARLDWRDLFTNLAARIEALLPPE